MAKCKCGCGLPVARRWVSGHNLKGLERTAAHRASIAEAQRRAWQTKRQRLPVGATRTDYHGYVRVKVLPGKGAWKLQHVIVAEGLIGRTLTERECVHHINGDRQDNRPENLYVCSDRARHNEVHRSQDRAFRELLTAGLVVFRGGRYETLLPR